jgi:signal transduction histidine kinase
MGPTILVPLRLRGRAFGTLSVAKHVGGAAFEDGAVGLLEVFADQASVALEYGRAQSQMQRLAVMDDRERIAKELHDGIIQSLFAVGMGLQAAASVSGSADISQRIDNAVDEIDRSIRDLRNYIFGLRPGILADRHLDQALKEMAAEFAVRSAVEVDVAIDPAVAADLAPRAADLVQLTREALSNVSRHASARRCWVSLKRAGARAVLSVRDDGAGFDVPGAPRGQGLNNLQARAKALGGSARVTSAPGKGTTVRVSIPTRA